MFLIIFPLLFSFTSASYAYESGLNLERYRLEVILAGARSSLITIEQESRSRESQETSPRYPYIGAGQTVQTRVFLIDRTLGLRTEVTGENPLVSYYVVGKCLEVGQSGVITGLVCSSDEKLAQLWVAYRPDMKTKSITFSSYFFDVRR